MKLYRQTIVIIVACYIAPLLFSFTSTLFIGISVISGLMFFEENRNFIDATSVLTMNKKKQKTVLLVILIFLAFVLRILYSFGMIDSGLSIEKINILPTFTLLYYCIVGIFFELKNKHKRKFKFKYIISFIPLSICFILNYTVMSDDVMEAIDAFTEIWNCIFVAAFCEELFFRSAIYNVISEISCKKVACIFSALCFALWHLNLIIPLLHYFSLMLFINLLMVFMLGMITAVIYEKCGIIYSVLFHAINNGLIIYILKFAESIT